MTQDGIGNRDPIFTSDSGKSGDNILGTVDDDLEEYVFCIANFQESDTTPESIKQALNVLKEFTVKEIYYNGQIFEVYDFEKIKRAIDDLLSDPKIKKEDGPEL